MKTYYHFFYGLLIFLSCLAVASQTLMAQTKPTKNTESPYLTRILFIYDASNSMWGDWQSDKKVHIASRLLSRMIDSLAEYENTELALRVYGHQKEYSLYDCSDTKLEIPFSSNNHLHIKQKLKSLYPKGTTPIARSLEAAANDFPNCKNCRNIIILITDGIEECDGDPCAISQELQKKGIILKPFIIGIGMNFKNDFDCVGTYIDASSERDFDNALQVVVNQIFYSTSCQVSLLDINGLPTESNVNMTFYDSYTHKELYNYIHTMNTRGVPDTLYLDPRPSYDIIVHTIPPVGINNVKLVPGKHTIIPIDAPRGNLLLKTTSSKNNHYLKTPIIVRKAGSQDILNVQYIHLPETYLVGKYDLEMLCLPRIKINDININQSYTTQIKIPSPGIAIVQKNKPGYGSLYVIRNNTMEWIYNLREDDTQESILLQPGTYRIVFREKYEYQTIKTHTSTFIIRSDANTNVQIGE